MNEPLEQLRRCEAFRGADTPALKALAAGSKLCRFSPRVPVYLASDRADSLCLLVDGRIALGHVNELGKRSWLTFVDPGELFGEQALCSSPVRDQCAESFETSRVLIIPAKVVRQLLSTRAALAASMLEAVGRRMMQTNRRWRRQFYLSNRERLIHVLLDLADQYGSHDGTTIAHNRLVARGSGRVYRKHSRKRLRRNRPSSRRGSDQLIASPARIVPPASLDFARLPGVG